MTKEEAEEVSKLAHQAAVKALLTSLGALGAANLLTIIGSLAVVFFVLPGRALQQAAGLMQARLEPIEARLADKAAAAFAEATNAQVRAEVALDPLSRLQTSIDGLGVNIRELKSDDVSRVSQLIKDLGNRTDVSKILEGIMTASQVEVGALEFALDSERHVQCAGSGATRLVAAAIGSYPSSEFTVRFPPAMVAQPHVVLAVYRSDAQTNGGWALWRAELVDNSVTSDGFKLRVTVGNPDGGNKVGVSWIAAAR